MNGRAMRFGWHAKSYTPTMASVRLRVIEPIAVLRDQGVDVEPYDKKTGPHGYDAIVFSKSFSADAIRIARTMRARGGGVVFDICDNLFEGKMRIDRARRSARVRAMLDMATHVTVSTQTLAQQLMAEMPEMSGKCRVIPDVIDWTDGPQTLSLQRSERQSLAQLRQFLGNHGRALHCVWFGKSQGRRAGFAHLGSAVQRLEEFARTHPVTLTVIGNNRWQCWRASRRWEIPTFFMPWSLKSFGSALTAHQVAIVPVEKNGYTIGKTINRPATAIMAGLGVVADSIDSYEELRRFIPLDDWMGGLLRYTTQPPAQDGKLQQARNHLRQRYGKDAVGVLWANLFDELASGGVINQTAK